MNYDGMRKAFEEKFTLTPRCVFYEGKYGYWVSWDEYAEPEFSTGMGFIQTKWEAFQAGWKASRESLVVELPPKISQCNMTASGYVRPEAENYDEDIDDCRQAIESLGLRIKS